MNTQNLNHIKKILLDEKLIFRRKDNSFYFNTKGIKKFNVNSWEELKPLLIQRYPELDNYFKEFPYPDSLAYALSCNLLESPKCTVCGKPCKLSRNAADKRMYNPSNPLSKFQETCGDDNCIAQAHLDACCAGIDKNSYAYRVKEILFKEKIITADKENPFKIRFNPNYLKIFKADSWDELRNLLLEKYPELKEYFERFPDGKGVLHSLSHNLKEVPKCPYCGKPRKFSYCLNTEIFKSYKEKLDPNSANFLAHYNLTCGSKECITKAKEDACIESLGVRNPGQSEEVQKKMKETNLRLRGTEYAAQDPEVKRKIQETCLRNNGVRHALQSKELLSKARRKYTYQGIQFDSKPEIAFLRYHQDHNIPIEIHPDPIDYIDDLGTAHKYFPDFKVGDQLIEIKGDHLLDKEGKLSCDIFYRSKPKDEDYDKDKVRSIAKAKCMKENSVKVLFKKDYSFYIKYIHNTYGKDWFDQFKNLAKEASG